MVVDDRVGGSDGRADGVQPLLHISENSSLASGGRFAASASSSAINLVYCIRSAFSLSYCLRILSNLIFTLRVLVPFTGSFVAIHLVFTFHLPSHIELRNHIRSSVADNLLP